MEFAIGLVLGIILGAVVILLYLIKEEISHINFDSIPDDFNPKF